MAHTQQDAFFGPLQRRVALRDTLQGERLVAMGPLQFDDKAPEPNTPPPEFDGWIELDDKVLAAKQGKGPPRTTPHRRLQWHPTRPNLASLLTQTSHTARPRMQRREPLLQRRFDALQPRTMMPHSARLLATAPIDTPSSPLAPTAQAMASPWNRAYKVWAERVPTQVAILHQDHTLRAVAPALEPDMPRPLIGAASLDTVENVAALEENIEKIIHATLNDYTLHLTRVFARKTQVQQARHNHEKLMTDRNHQADLKTAANAYRHELMKRFSVAHLRRRLVAAEEENATLRQKKSKYKRDVRRLVKHYSERLHKANEAIADASARASAQHAATSAMAQSTTNKTRMWLEMSMPDSKEPKEENREKASVAVINLGDGIDLSSSSSSDDDDDDDDDKKDAETTNVASLDYAAVRRKRGFQPASFVRPTGFQGRKPLSPRRAPGQKSKKKKEPAQLDEGEQLFQDLGEAVTDGIDFAITLPETEEKAEVQKTPTMEDVAEKEEHVPTDTPATVLRPSPAMTELGGAPQPLLAAATRSKRDRAAVDAHDKPQTAPKSTYRGKPNKARRNKARRRRTSATSDVLSEASSGSDGPEWDIHIEEVESTGDAKPKEQDFALSSKSTQRLKKKIARLTERNSTLYESLRKANVRAKAANARFRAKERELVTLVDVARAADSEQAGSVEELKETHAKEIEKLNHLHGMLREERDVAQKAQMTQQAELERLRTIEADLLDLRVRETASALQMASVTKNLKETQHQLEEAVAARVNSVAEQARLEQEFNRLSKRTRNRLVIKSVWFRAQLLRLDRLFGIALSVDEYVRPQLTCPSCLELLRVPQTLYPCGHTLCSRCIHAIRSEAQKRGGLHALRCRECKRDADLHSPNPTLEGLMARYGWWSVMLRDARTELVGVARHDTNMERMWADVTRLKREDLADRAEAAVLAAHKAKEAAAVAETEAQANKRDSPVARTRTRKHKRSASKRIMKGA